MDTAVTLRRLDELAVSIEKLGQDCENKTREATWECARGKRNGEAVRAVKKLTGELSQQLISARNVLQIAWAHRENGR